ncbi:hypothetical protein AAMO2058_000565700 [Amorphochlora amoebiformis]
MMENAGRNLAQQAIHSLRIAQVDCRSARIVVLAGSGGNGGGGICAARHLVNHGAANLVLCLSSPQKLKPVTRWQLKVFRSAGGKEVTPSELREKKTTSTSLKTDLIIDAVVGYSLRGAPRGTAQELIRWANDSSAHILSLDTPSGLDSTTGETPGDYIKATWTLTLALPKTGLSDPSKTGEIYLADIGIPRACYTAETLRIDYCGKFFGGHYRIPLRIESEGDEKVQAARQKVSKATVDRIVFLGTSSGVPTAARGTSCVALRLSNKQVVLFDCGEGSHRQIIKSKSITASRIRHIFITHLHGDHSFGLFGLINALHITSNNSKINIYGPLGIRRFVESVILISASSLDHVNIVEISGDSPPAIDIGSGITVTPRKILHVKELECYGYIVKESPRRGKLDAKAAKELGAKGRELGILACGKDIVREDGTIIEAQRVTSPPSPGIKIALLWDTYDASNAKKEATECSLLIHEATFTSEQKENAAKYGHSTAAFAVRYALEIKAKALVMTHISARFQMDNKRDEGVKPLLEEALKTLGNSSLPVVIADDFMEMQREGDEFQVRS